MRPVKKITAIEEYFSTVELIPGNSRFMMSKRDPIEPEPVGTIIITAFKITGYDPDCDGSLMARLAQIDKNGENTGWTQNAIGLYPDTDIVCTLEEWKQLFDVNKWAGRKI
jgi:hypothetical protein